MHDNVFDLIHTCTVSDWESSHYRTGLAVLIVELFASKICHVAIRHDSV